MKARATGPEAVTDGPDVHPLPLRTWRFYLPRLLGPILFVGIVLRLDLSQVLAQISQIAMAHLFIAIGICLVIVAMKSWRWMALLRASGYGRIPIAEALHVTADALYWGTLTPGRIGEFKRVLYLRRAHGLSIAHGAAFCLMDRAFDVVAIGGLLLFSAAAAPQVWSQLVGKGPIYIGLALVSSAILLVRPLLHGLIRLSGRYSWLDRLAGAIARDALKIGAAWLSMIIISSVLAFCLYVAMVWVLALSLPFSLSLPMTGTAVAVTMLVGALPVSFFNFGTRELALIALFSQLGLSGEDAISFSFLFVLCYLALMFSSWVSARFSRLLAQGV